TRRPASGRQRRGFLRDRAHRNPGDHRAARDARHRSDRTRRGTGNRGGGGVRDTRGVSKEGTMSTTATQYKIFIGGEPADAFSADNLRFFAGAARNLEGKSTGEYIAGYTSMIRREPIGIVGGICPWNYPLMMAVWKMGPALAAGNVQILKPSEQTPLSLLRFVQLAQEVIPTGVLQVVTGDGVPAGERLVAHPDVRLVSLTGDVSTGKAIARNAA